MATLDPTKLTERVESGFRMQSPLSFTSAATADEFVLDVAGAKEISIEVKGGSADTYKVYGSLNPEATSAGITKEITAIASLATTPQKIDNANLSKIKLVRTGATDGTVTIFVLLNFR